MTITEFKELTEGIQYIMISIGVAIGGVWAIYRFRILKETDKAKVELQQIKKQIEERGTIQMDVEIEQLHEAEDHFVITAITKLSNIGNKTEVLDLKQSRTKVGRLEWNEKNELDFSNILTPIIHSISYNIDSVSISPANEVNVSFIFKLKEKGTYLIEIDIPGSADETQSHVNAFKNSGIEPLNVRWHASKYFQVS